MGKSPRSHLQASPVRGGLAQSCLDAPLGLSAMRIFLWLISVAAALGLLSLIVLRPSLVFTSDSSELSESTQVDQPGGLEGAVCSFPTSETYGVTP